ncbi:hypothetical protein ACFWMJ_18745 [Streptomyces hawaiiensis]|uniref:hypothetical protein n=1 Tax=Streptomyces hawaiiensis TaxID=67305 RepID=UPI0036637318
MPAGVMVILVVHCLRDLPLTWSRAPAPPAALAATVELRLWRRDAVLSILAGTAVPVALAGTPSLPDAGPAVAGDRLNLSLSPAWVPSARCGAE